MTYPEKGESQVIDRLPDATIRQWAASDRLSHQVAAKLAREVRGLPRWFPVGTERELAPRLGVSITTVSLAKRLLAQHGMIIRHGNRYHVA
jgi:DNA-binding GntR family transcriptional regulator